MINEEEEKHKVWITCMKTSNLNPTQAHAYVKSVEAFLHQPITPTGQNILIVASTVGAYYVVKQCLIRGAQPNHQDTAGRTALHYAASIGNIGIFQQLIKYGGNPLQQTIGGETPLTKACIFSQGDIIEWYLNNSIECFKILDNFGNMPLQMLKLEGKQLYAQVSAIYNELTQSEMTD